MQHNEQIDEVPPEQEEGESQENIHSYKKHQQQVLQATEIGNGLDGGEEEPPMQEELDQNEEMAQGGDDEEIELNEQQLAELLQNMQNLPHEQQVQLQMLLKEKMKEDILNERA